MQTHGATGKCAIRERKHEQKKTSKIEREKPNWRHRVKNTHCVNRMRCTSFCACYDGAANTHVALEVSPHMEKWKRKWKLAPKTIQITLGPFVRLVCAYQWMHLSTFVCMGSLRHCTVYMHTVGDMEAPCVLLHVLLSVFKCFLLPQTNITRVLTKHRAKVNALPATAIVERLKTWTQYLYYPISKF